MPPLRVGEILPKFSIIQIYTDKGEIDMRTAVLIMKRIIVAEAIKQMNKNPFLQLYIEQDYISAEKIIQDYGADVVLVEVSESESCNISCSLALCAHIRSKAPFCRLILMCPEHDSVCIDHAIRAKSNKQIDDFLFYDSSIEYILSSIMAL